MTNQKHSMLWRHLGAWQVYDGGYFGFSVKQHRAIEWEIFGKRFSGTHNHTYSVVLLFSDISRVKAASKNILFYVLV